MGRFLAKIAVVFSLALCGCVAVGEYLYFDGIDKFKWVPVYVAETEGVEIPPEFKSEFGQIYISFAASPDGYEVRGMSGCNIFNGGMELKGGREVEFTKMLTTRRAGKYAGFERKFLGALSKTHFVVRDGNFLYFCNKKGGREMTVLKFRKEEG